MKLPKLSIQALDALTNIISGGPCGFGHGNSDIWIYRSGPDLESFMNSHNIEFSVGRESRVPTLKKCLIRTNNNPNERQKLVSVIESALDPRAELDRQDEHAEMVSHFNKMIKPERLVLREDDGRMRLESLTANSELHDTTLDNAESSGFDTVIRDLNRARKDATEDPESAITSACSVIESALRSILTEMNNPIPDNKSIKSLYRETSKCLDLSPGRKVSDEEIKEDVHRILSGLAGIIDGVGALRSHGGDAHGREKGYKRVDERIAILCVDASSTMAKFLIDTWKKKRPSNTSSNK